jgi:hypothetical protein
VRDKIVHESIESWTYVLHWGAPSVLGVVLTLIGWWMARRAGRLPLQPQLDGRE